MSRPLVLHIDPDPDGGWRVVLGPPGAAATRGRLDASVVASIGAAVAAAQRPDPVTIPGRADRVEGRELAAGRALARTFEPSTVARVMGEHCAMARSRHQPLLIALDTPHREVAALPWELLATGPEAGFLEEGDGTVARLGVGTGSPVFDAAQLRLLVWCPTPDDPACAEALSALSRIDGAELVVLGAALCPPLPPAAPDTADVLILIGHGASLDSGPSLTIGAQRAGPRLALPPRLGAQGSIALVIVGICEGGAPDALPSADLASRLLREGAPAVVSSPVPIRAESLLEFTRGLVQALLDEAPLAVAAQLGRRDVARLLEAHPDSRPWAFQLRAATMEVLQARCVRRRWRPNGWPTVAADLAALLARAQARAGSGGWFGVEHLLEAWPTEAQGLVGQLGAIISAELPTLLPLLRRHHHQVSTDCQEMLCTPRVRRLGAALPSEQATLFDLAMALVDDPTSPLHALERRPLQQLHWEPARFGV